MVETAKTPVGLFHRGCSGARYKGTEARGAARRQKRI